MAELILGENFTVVRLNEFVECKSRRQELRVMLAT